MSAGAVGAVRKALKKLIFGPPDYPQQVIVGMLEPQSDVTVYLRTSGPSDGVHDVTRIHMMACASPFTVAIGTAERAAGGAPANWGETAELEFWERAASPAFLGQIELRHSGFIPSRGASEAGAAALQLFRATGSRNKCLPAARIWARYAEYAYYRWKQPSPDVDMRARDVHAMCVHYNCPRPVGLVSVSDGTATNLFPMNLMGPVGGGRFAFALNTGKPVTQLIERVRRIAISTVPLVQAKTVYAMAMNHKKDSIDVTDLPFSVRRSAEFGFPVPEFALRVREMEVEEIARPGSHTLFLARVLRDVSCEPAGRAAPQFFTLHGIYQARRAPHEDFAKTTA
jgi:flavin reductase (DIM6/NTAB) family NADH-FMN oxidoreductase RutF